VDTVALAHPVATDAAFIVAVSVAAILVAKVTWQVLEKPALGLKERLAPR
jgi:hypothetical protein